MPKALKWKIPLILFVLGLSLWYALPPKERIDLGLDLQGGMHLVLHVDTSGLPEKAKEGATERALEIIRNRVDQFGVKEPLIHRQGKEGIVVELPGVTDRERALALLGKTALLEFKLVSDDDELISKAKQDNIPEGYELHTDEAGESILVEQKASLTGSALSDARVDFGSYGEPEVHFTLNREGARKFSKLTGENIGRRLAIILDARLQAAPVIQSRIQDAGRITGRYTREQASDLAIVLRAGALPAPIQVEEERTVGPLLGKDSIKAGIKASIIGFILVIGFMLLYYLIAGLIADVALLMNFLIIMGGLGLFHATLTLPGIAGIILTLGMAVDANVLIYERIREELTVGKPLRMAINTGYNKAFSAILDSNLTTLVAAFFLFQFGTGPIRGFAVTLTIGLVASMFTAIVVTKVIFDLLTLSKRWTSLHMLKLIGNTKIDFIKSRRLCYILSAMVLIMGLSIFFLRGERSYAIDFTGGELQEYLFEKPLNLDVIRAALKEVGLGNATLQQVELDPKRIIIRTPQDSAGKISESLKMRLADNRFDILRVERVGPAVGKDLKKRAFLAILTALAGILIYVAVRFKHLNFAVAGVIALFHDIFVTVGLMAVTNRELSLTTVAALLTIAGYSINDTIVIYDRVRENIKAVKKGSLSDIINLSVNQTLSRTILTSGVTLLAVMALLFFGGTVLNDFAFCLFVGFISGVYSTVYIASPLVITWQKK